MSEIPAASDEEAKKSVDKEKNDKEKTTPDKDLKKKPMNECPDCGRYFLTPQALKMHSQYVHAGEKIPCTKCDFVAGSKVLLRYLFIIFIN